MKMVLGKHALSLATWSANTREKNKAACPLQVNFIAKKFNLFTDWTFTFTMVSRYLKFVASPVIKELCAPTKDP